MKNSLKKIHMPIDDAYIMGKIPQVKAKVNLCIDKVKTIRYLCDETDILKRNVRELQEQLQNSHIRIKKLRAKLMQYEKLLNMLRKKP